MKLPSELAMSVSERRAGLAKVNESQKGKMNLDGSGGGKKSGEDMVALGTCQGLLVGLVEQQRLSPEGAKLWAFSTSSRTDVVTCIPYEMAKRSGGAKQKAGQCDNRMAKAFGKLLAQHKVTLVGVIKDSRIQYKVNRFVRQVEWSVWSKLAAVPLVVKRLAEMVAGADSAKKRKALTVPWTEKSIVLRYFEGEEAVVYEELRDAVMSVFSTVADQANLLEEMQDRFASALKRFNITAEDLEGINPNAIVSTKLKPHQRQGLQWMSGREKRMVKCQMSEVDEIDEYIRTEYEMGMGMGMGMENEEKDRNASLPPFFTEEEDDDTGDTFYLNQLNGEKCDVLPKENKGGLMADDMGLGKTLQMLSLICSNSGIDEHPPLGFGPSLIVCPKSVIGNWTRQIDEHIRPGKLKYYVYHHTQRENDPEFLRRHNVVITTYSIVQREFCDETDENREEMKVVYGKGLQYVQWLRVILDEAHIIRSKKSRKFKGCAALPAQSRWAVTGTPVQNKLDDLYSLFKFLRLHPVSELEFWTKFIVQPLKNSDVKGFNRLRLIMEQLCIRRMKTILTLGDKNSDTIELELDAEEKEIYGSVFERYKSEFRKLQQQGGDKAVLKKFSSVLSMLLRMRQCCAHTALVPDDVRLAIANKRKNESGSGSVTPGGDAVEGLDEMEDCNEDCFICGKPPNEPLLTACHHMFCGGCFYAEFDRAGGGGVYIHCPVCGEKLSKRDVKEERQQDDDEAEGGDSSATQVAKVKKARPKRLRKFRGFSGGPSTKIRHLIKDLKDNVIGKSSSPEIDPRPDKAVVFSQWTDMLDIVQGCLDRENIRTQRLDGSMTLAAREASMEKFRQDPDIPVFLMSLKAGNLGVNMTAANRVYLLDPWWNPATEDQAVDRVYRLGQKKNVWIKRYVIKDSVEMKIVQIQLRKRQLMEGAMGKGQMSGREERRQEWIKDLHDLFK